jgi:tetratricopeptide (TPR) repeat protein
MHINDNPSAIEAMMEIASRVSTVLKTHGNSQLHTEFDNIVTVMQGMVDAASQEKSHAVVSKANLATSQRQIFDDLNKAVEIWRRVGHHRGLGNALAEIGWLHLDHREFVKAMRAAKEAISSGKASRCETVQARGWILAIAVAWTVHEDDLTVGSPHQQAFKAKSYATNALKNAHKAEPQTHAEALTWAGLAQLAGGSDTNDYQQAEQYYKKAGDIFRRHHCSSSRAFERLHRILYGEKNHEMALCREKLQKWAGNPRGLKFSEIEVLVTRLAWSVSGTIEKLRSDLSICRHRAQGLIDRAGINSPSAPKMTKRSTG